MNFKVLLPFFIGLLLVTGARAYPPDDVRNYRNTAFIRAHFVLNAAIRHLKADLDFVPSCDAKTALLADFQALQEYPDIEWYAVPEETACQKIVQDEAALEPLLKSKPVTRKKFHRDEKAFDAAVQGWNDANA